MDNVKVYRSLDTFIKLDSFSIKDLYCEYKKSYYKIHKYANKIREEYKNTDNKDKIKERKVVYDAEKEMLEILIMLETYLPWEQRYFIKRELNKYLNMVYDKSSIIGFTPMLCNIDDISEVVQNKILQGELLRMMKELLTKKQYTCMYMYFWEGKTFEEIGIKINITKQGVNEIIKYAVNKIKKSEYLIDFLKYI